MGTPPPWLIMPQHRLACRQVFQRDGWPWLHLVPGCDDRCIARLNGPAYASSTRKHKTHNIQYKVMSGAHVGMMMLAWTRQGQIKCRYQTRAAPDLLALTESVHMGLSGNIS
jgi:hypothetical protein